MVSSLLCAYRFPRPRAARAASMAQTISRERGLSSYNPAFMVHSSITVAMPSARLIHTL